MNTALITDTVSAILKQGKLGEEYRADFTKAIAAVWQDGASTSTTVVRSAPLADHEIASFRQLLMGGIASIAEAAAAAAVQKIAAKV